MKKETGVGVGLRPKHYELVTSGQARDIDWFEVISENFMFTEGPAIRILEKVRQDFPIALHGVSLSIGSERCRNERYLTALQSLIERIDPFLVSDHVCWTGSSCNFHELLPAVYNKDMLKIMADNLDFVQNKIGRTIILENLSAYLQFARDDYAEWEYLVELNRLCGCRYLLDINNVYVNSVNFSFDPLVYIDALPVDSVAQMHLAGHEDTGRFLFDTHSRPVCSEVWLLFEYAIQRFPDVPVLVEWDQDIPEFRDLAAEAVKARKIRANASPRKKEREFSTYSIV